MQSRRTSLASPLGAAGFLLLVLTSALLATCGKEVVNYDALYLSVSSEVTPEPIARLKMMMRNVQGAPAFSFPDNPLDDNDPNANWALTGKDITKAPFVVKLEQAGKGGPASMVVLGNSASGKLLASWSGIVDTTGKSEIAVMLEAPKALCDGDMDGVKDCTKADCCVAGEQSDCEDGIKPGAAQANPFMKEEPCFECLYKVDQNCDGVVSPCADTDKDGVPDCQEQDKKCGVGADKDGKIFPGAKESCDGKDNDCNGKTDEGLSFTDIDGKTSQGQNNAPGVACGKGACAGGVMTCTTDGVGLVCSSQDDKQGAESCDTPEDDNCDGQVNEGCGLADLDGDGVKNDDEAASCKYTLAMYHAEYHKGAKEACCLAYTGGTPTVELLESCDFNCDGTLSACDPNDKDGDGQVDGFDCNDADPKVFPGAPEKCGDGIDQNCTAGDLACDGITDADKDSWPPPADCDDTNPNVHPWAEEACNGKDDDCDGVVDDGNPGGVDLTCGSLVGECDNTHGVLVCKHYIGDQKPDALDCKTSYDGKSSEFDPKSGTCVGCFGDQRPVAEICDYKDNNCDGTSDEDFTYTQEGGTATLGVNAKCTAIGGCAKDQNGLPIQGTVECLVPTPSSQATCSTDANGSNHQDQPEVCNNVDDNCNSVTDENLTSLSDSTCRKIGVCAAGAQQKVILTKCHAGQWYCDYTAVKNIEFDGAQSCDAGEIGCQCADVEGGKECHPLHESSCDGMDNDCDGKVDDDFTFLETWSGKTLKIGDDCGTGDCANGLVACKSDKSGLECTTLITKKEKCDGKDNDCNGQTDDGMTVDDSDCAIENIGPKCCKLIGVCSKQNVTSTCPGGSWVCNYSGTPDYDGEVESNCDALDNDCDGSTDEDFTFSEFDKTLKKGDGCGTGECKGGTVQCMGTKIGLECSTYVNKILEACDGKDNDCNGLTDETFPWGGNVVGQPCDGVGECGQGTVECKNASTATCSTNPDGSKPEATTEVCNGKDDNCDGATDENCDDDLDGYCDVDMIVVGTPPVCLKGGGDCQDTNGQINPGVTEICDGIDNDCNGKTDETFFFTEAQKSLPIAAECGLGECSGGKVVCGADKNSATCSTLGKKLFENCDNKDNDCDGLTDEDFKWNLIVVGQPCDGIGECGGGVVECVAQDKANCSTNPATTLLPAGTKNQAIPELCDGLDNDCNGVTDDAFTYKELTATKKLGEGCGLGECKGGSVVCATDKSKATCSTLTKAAAEICDNLDNSCDGTTDETCKDVDKDGYCDAANTVVATPPACPKGGGDCVDNDAAIYPGATEACDTKDNDCDGKTDAQDPTDVAKTAPNCENPKGVCAGIPKPAALCANGIWTSCSNAEYAAGAGSSFETTESKCDNKDNDCDGSLDEGCDDDGDKWCDDQMTTIGFPSVCPNGGGDCNDTLGSQDVYPGATEHCDNKDNNCNGKIDAADAISLEAAAPACSKTVGACQGTKKVAALCQSGKWGDCTTNVYQAANPQYQQTETTCDNIDNDCDGAVDANCDQDGDKYCRNDPGWTTIGNPTACTNGGGDCMDSGAQANTINPGAAEVCDGKDNNCNSAVDVADGTFDNSTIPACDNQLGVCKGSKKPKSLCNGSWNACVDATYQAYATSYEIGAEKTCDGLDNNCDNKTDDTYAQKGADCDGNSDGCIAGSWTCPSGSLVCAGDANKVNDPCDTNGDSCKTSKWTCPSGKATTCPTEASDKAGDLCDSDGDSCKDGALGCVSNALVCQNDSVDKVGDVCDGDADACKDGTFACDKNKLVCQNDAAPKANDACDGDADTCSDGKLTCSGNALSCTGDGEDKKGDACDGDNDLCKDGTFGCSNNALVCQNDAAPKANDACDGDADNCKDGKLTCAANVLSCTGDGASKVNDWCDKNADGCLTTKFTCVSDALSCPTETNKVGDACDGNGDKCKFGAYACGTNALTCSGDGPCVSGLTCNEGQQKCTCVVGSATCSKDCAGVDWVSPLPCASGTCQSTTLWCKP